MRNQIDSHQLKALQSYSYSQEQNLAAVYGPDDSARMFDLEQVLFRAGASVFTDASGERIADALASLVSWGHEEIPEASDAIAVDERTLDTPYSASEIEHIREAITSVGQREGLRAAVLRGAFGLVWEDIAADAGVSVRTVRSKARKASLEFTKQVTGRVKLAGCGEHDKALPKAIYGLYADGSEKDLAEVNEFFEHADVCQTCHDEYVTVRRAFEVAAAFMPPRPSATVAPATPPPAGPSIERPLDVDDVLAGAVVADPVIEVFAPAPIDPAPVAEELADDAPDDAPAAGEDENADSEPSQEYDGSAEAPYDWFADDTSAGTDVAAFEDFEIEEPEPEPAPIAVDFAAAAALEAEVLEDADLEPEAFTPIPEAEAPAPEPVIPDEPEPVSETVAEAAVAEEDTPSDSTDRFDARPVIATGVGAGAVAGFDWSTAPMSVQENRPGADDTYAGPTARVANDSPTGRYSLEDVNYYDEEEPAIDRRMRRAALVAIVPLLALLLFFGSYFLPGNGNQGAVADKPPVTKPVRNVKKKPHKPRHHRRHKSSPKPRSTPAQPTYTPAAAPVQQAPAAPSSSHSGVGDGSSEFLPEERG